MEMITYGKPVYYDYANKKAYDVISSNQVEAVDEGVIVGDKFLTYEVVNDMANKIMEDAKKPKKEELFEEFERNGYVENGPGVVEALTVPVEEIKFIPPFPENCPIDPKHHATGPAMDLTGEIKAVDVYRKADDEDIAVVPNGIIHDGEFISTSQIAEASMLGCQLCKVYAKETGKLPKSGMIEI